MTRAETVLLTSQERAICAAIRWAGLDLSGFHITPLQGVSHVLKAAAEIAEQKDRVATAYLSWSE